MTVFFNDEFIALASARQDPAVSIYMPTHRVTTEFRQDCLRLKNLLRKPKIYWWPGACAPQRPRPYWTRPKKCSYRHKIRQKAEVKYQELSGTEKVSHDLQKIVPAAYHGKVEFLFVALGRQEWGLYDAEQDEVRYAPALAPGAEDMLDAAASQTILKEGKVFTMAAEAVPSGSPIAAIFQY
jgi:hypothetical protein